MGQGRRDVVQGLPLYQQGAAVGEGAVKLSSNENPFEPLPSVVEAVSQMLSGFNRYPSMGAEDVRTAIAEHVGVDMRHVAVGAGSTEVASQLMHALCGAGDEVVFPWRSFEAYPILTQVAGATPVPVPLTKDLRHDLDAMADAITDRTRLIFLCTPNNPTGTVLHADEVEEFLAKVPQDVVVVMDEAYCHFNRDTDAVDGLALLDGHPNVVALRTFSKAYGLAGLRIGFAISSIEISDDLRRVATPFTVTSLAQQAAIASLAVEDELNERVDRIVAERIRVFDELTRQGWPVLPSQANFLWLATGDDTDRIDGVMVSHGVFARCWSGEGIRVSIGSPDENDRAIEALSQAIKG
ncbi:histidinol-phosphate transaminase [Cutibacterium sp. WCA-380-WT-3A]|uniref:Aromatic amino acid aminotransferase n=1 Tax=Cutibacterium porci TaxID=2605781 RepID=A0A7K0J448_9ACTN|nr:histidinol-phosphate transaminase [Cutibacterium porci]MSS44706.1 histidinol-phosphate transaminase [Cutibacterium porci]